MKWMLRGSEARTEGLAADGGRFLDKHRGLPLRVVDLADPGRNGLCRQSTEQGEAAPLSNDGDRRPRKPLEHRIAPDREESSGSLRQTARGSRGARYQSRHKQQTLSLRPQRRPPAPPRGARMHAHPPRHRRAQTGCCAAPADPARAGRRSPRGSRPAAAIRPGPRSRAGATGPRGWPAPAG